ncbi:hypothetical protein FB45DRAFT_869639 [Roridomyces roridus]|uniref:Uncharacterized protein n=1 Tax=Roridomyces roridus TaxID=1738132 RepID=A0AAD7BME4_9AGAR|nr:hypothetical protein FB45DRAFT_869639 [Roridomyces roridus]
MAVYTCPMPFSRGTNFGNYKDHDGSTKKFWFVVLFQGGYTLYSDAASRTDERLRGRDLFIFMRHVHAEEFWAHHCLADHHHQEHDEKGPARHIPTPPPSPSPTDDDDLFIDDTPPKKKQRGETVIPSLRSPSLLTPAPKAAVKLETPHTRNKSAGSSLVVANATLRADSISSPVPAPAYSVSTPLPSSSSASSSPRVPGFFVFQSPTKKTLFKGTLKEAAAAVVAGERFMPLTEEELADEASFFA